MAADAAAGKSSIFSLCNFKYTIFESFIHSLVLSVIEDAVNLIMQVGFTTPRPWPLFPVLCCVFVQFLLSAYKEQSALIATILHGGQRITLFRHQINEYKMGSFLSHPLQCLKRVYLLALFSNPRKAVHFFITPSKYIGSHCATTKWSIQCVTAKAVLLDSMVTLVVSR